MENQGKQKSRFLPIFGITLGSALGLTLIYALIFTGFSLTNWSNSLCVSAMLVGAGSIIPVFFDAGRGVAIAGKVSAKGNEQKEVLDAERNKREAGMSITFALAAATVVIGLISIILSLI